MIRLDSVAAELLVRAEIPGRPPTVNTIWKRGVRGVYKNPSAAAWQMMAKRALIDAKSKYRIKKPCKGWFCVEVLIYTKGELTAFDADNHIKGAQDCLAYAGIIEDDKYVLRSCGTKMETKGPTRTVIEVWKVPEKLEGEK